MMFERRKHNTEKKRLAQRHGEKDLSSHRKDERIAKIEVEFEVRKSFVPAWSWMPSRTQV